MKIEKGIKFKKDITIQKWGYWIRVVDKMKIGDSVLCDREQAESLQQAGRRYRGMNMVRRKISQGKFRVWKMCRNRKLSKLVSKST